MSWSDGLSLVFGVIVEVGSRVYFILQCFNHLKATVSGAPKALKVFRIAQPICTPAT